MTKRFSLQWKQRELGDGDKIDVYVYTLTDMNRGQSLEVHEAYYFEDNQLKHCTGECKGQ